MKFFIAFITFVANLGFEVHTISDHAGYTLVHFLFADSLVDGYITLWKRNNAIEIEVSWLRTIYAPCGEFGEPTCVDTRYCRVNTDDFATGVKAVLRGRRTEDEDSTLYKKLVQAYLDKTYPLARSSK